MAEPRGMDQVASATAPPFVSIIVPARERAEVLARCLDPLSRQSWPADRLEIIVVDNGAPEDLSTAISATPRGRLVAEPRPGSYAARNRGVREARGDVFAFTDADCIPAPGWVEHGVAALLAPAAPGFVAGRVDTFAHDPAHPTAAELYDLTVLRFRQDWNVAERQFAATANMFTTRAAFERVGPFDADLRSGGDMEWGRRATALGLAGAYAEGALVRHPARRSLVETCRREARVAGGTWQMLSRTAPPARRAVDLMRSLMPALPFYARILASADPPRFLWRCQVVGVALLAKYVGAWERIRVALGGKPHRG